ncbi:MAG: type III-A CRISPR-associated RAMP protein Csm3 [Candidatus Omnitrophota bacterium]|jgi:CRISPR-associated protein Csm3|nr:MAG: type III-A CRISPR-associated RAMP protein Csm3 [Candidatus Omnitrophota bacterium]
MNKLTGHRIMRGVVLCVAGLRIGGSKESLEIGGTDNPILRHPITRHPYIPGSSLKGKIRSLLEQKECENVRRTGKPCDCGKCTVCKIFGCASARNTQDVTRVIFRDCQLTGKSLEKLKQAQEEHGVPFAESKAEVSIDRKTGTASRSGPRWQERIPEGTEFDIEIVLRHFDGDPIDEYENFIREGIKLLQNDTLGGSGSRGYGKVLIKDLTAVDE